jgi:hypothetical protein
MKQRVGGLGLKKFTTLLLAHKQSLETMWVCSARQSSKGLPNVDSDPLAKSVTRNQ